MIDIEKLLIDHEGDSVCGNNYEYNALMVEMQAATQGKPEQRLGDGFIEAEEPDWRLVKKNCLELCKKTHHLEVYISLAQALMNLDGFHGFAEGSGILASVIENYWKCLYPQIDPSDNDPVERINQLAVFDDFTFILSAKKVQLLKSVMGSMSYYDIQKSKEYKGEDDDSTHDPKLISAIFNSGSSEDIEHVYESINNCIDNFERITVVMKQDDFVGVNQAPGFQELLKLLNSAKSVMGEHLDSTPSITDAVDETMDNDNEQTVEEGHKSLSDTGNVVPQELMQGIHSRKAAIAAIEEVEEYFIKNEPSSPIPFMLQRTRRMVDKDFISLMEDLAPDGVGQAETVLGTSKND